MLHEKIPMLVFLLLLSMMLLASCQQMAARPSEQSKPLTGTADSAEGFTVKEDDAEDTGAESSVTEETDEEGSPSPSAPTYPRDIPTEWYDITTFVPDPPDNPQPVTYGRIEVGPDLWLVIKKWTYDTSYFIQHGTMGRMLAAAIENAEIELVTPDVIRFRTCASANRFHRFPHQIIYHVDEDELVEDVYYWDCAEPFRFNYYLDADGPGNHPHRTGHEVLGVAADGDTVTVWFSQVAEYLKWDRPPETTTSSDESCTFSLLFVGSKVSQEVIDKTGELGSTAACRSLSLAQTSEGVQLSITLTQPMEFRVDYISGGGLSMTIWLRGK